MDLHVLLTHCRLADGRLVDVGIAGGRIAAIGEDTAPSLSNRVPILDIGSVCYCQVSLMVTCISARPDGVAVDAACSGTGQHEPY